MEWKPIETAPWDREVLLTGSSGYVHPHERFVVNGYRVRDWHQGEWNDATGTHLSERGWGNPTHWAEMPLLPEQGRVTVLPDGSGFMVGSMPLPKDHWLYAPRDEWDNERDQFAECQRPILTNTQRGAVIAAARYAIRGATMCGQEPDFDPDALVLNFAYALCGQAQGL